MGVSSMEDRRGDDNVLRENDTLIAAPRIPNNKNNRTRGPGPKAHAPFFNIFFRPFRVLFQAWRQDASSLSSGTAQEPGPPSRMALSPRISEVAEGRAIPDNVVVLDPGRLFIFRVVVVMSHGRSRGHGVAGAQAARALGASSHLSVIRATAHTIRINIAPLAGTTSRAHAATVNVAFVF